jgi:hypothetical protein
VPRPVSRCTRFRQPQQVGDGVTVAQRCVNEIAPAVVTVGAFECHFPVKVEIAGRHLPAHYECGFTPITLKLCNSTIPIYDLSPSRRDDPLCGQLTLPANMDIRDVAPEPKNLEQPDNNGNDNDGVQN